MNQVDLLKKMSGLKRLEQAFELSDLIREIALSAINQEFPHLSKKEKMEKLIQRIYLNTYSKNPKKEASANYSTT